MRKPILIIDDDEEDCMLMKHSLDKAGFKDITTTSCEKEAVTLAKKRKPAVIIIDIILGHLDGFDICKKMRTLCGPQAKIIMVTGMISAADGEKAHESGADDLTMKGHNYLRLITEVKKMFEKKK